MKSNMNDSPRSAALRRARETIKFEDILAQDDIVAAVGDAYKRAMRNYPEGIDLTFANPRRAASLQSWIDSLRPRGLPHTLRPVLADDYLQIRETRRN